MEDNVVVGPCAEAAPCFDDLGCSMFDQSTQLWNGMFALCNEGALLCESFFPGSSCSSNAAVAASTAAEPTSGATAEPVSLLMVDPSVYENQIIITKVVSFLSAMGSAYIFISMVVNAHRKKKRLDRTFDRLLLCLCVSDFIASVSLFLGSW